VSDGSRAARFTSGTGFPATPVDGADLLSSLLAWCDTFWRGAFRFLYLGLGVA
jgi:hypothetical protein